MLTVLNIDFEKLIPAVMDELRELSKSMPELIQNDIFQAILRHLKQTYGAINGCMIEDGVILEIINVLEGTGHIKLRTSTVFWPKIYDII